jgi:hypothetical protein
MQMDTNEVAEVAKPHMLYNGNYCPFVRYQMFADGEHDRLRWMLWNYVKEETEEEDSDSDFD